MKVFKLFMKSLAGTMLFLLILFINSGCLVVPFPAING